MDIKSVPPNVDLGGATLIGGVLADLEPAPGSEDLLGSVDTALVAVVHASNVSGAHRSSEACKRPRETKRMAPTPKQR